MSVPCGKPTPTGRCQRLVAVPGGPCGAAHTDLVSATGTVRGGPEPIIGPGPDPLGSASAGVTLPAGVEERRELAGDPDTPPATLAVLADDSDGEVRSEVAWNPATPEATLERLVDNGEADTVGLNGAATPELLRRIVADHEYARDAVAMNPAAPPDLLILLSDSYPDYVAGNPSAPPEALARLAEFEPAVPILAAELDEAITPAEYAISVRRLVAGHGNCPPGTLDRLAGSQDRIVRAGVAANPNTRPGTLDRLAGDDRAVVRANAAINPAAPVAILERLAGDTNADVRMHVALNPNTPGWIRDALT